MPHLLGAGHKNVAKIKKTSKTGFYFFRYKKTQKKRFYIYAGQSAIKK